MMRKGISAVLRETGRWTSLGGVASLEEAHTVFPSLPRIPDLIILDLELRYMKQKEWGLEFIPWLKNHCKNRNGKVPPVLIYTVYDGYAHIKSAMDYGARGFVSKYEGQEELENAMRALLDGRVYISRSLLPVYSKLPGIIDTLTRREQQIFAFLQEDRDNQSIAERLGLSLHSVENYVSRIVDKLGLKNRRELRDL
jgi:NarL family two-component system response regulator LiaR